MADLNIPNLNMKSDKYIFKKKIKFKKNLKKDYLLNLFFVYFSLLLVYINYLIPNKNFLLKIFYI